MRPKRSFEFSHAISRSPSASVTGGIRIDDSGADPDAELFKIQHGQYIDAVRKAGVDLTLLEPLEAFPDSVFVEDPVLVVDGAAIVLRPGAASRFGEAAAIRPVLESVFPRVIELPETGYVDGGDVLLTENEALIGSSERTDARGVAALAEILKDFGYTTRPVDTPPGVLHFKSDCGLLDERTIFATSRLAASGCFEGYDVLHAPDGEEAAANLIRINDTVFINQGFAQTKKILGDAGYRVVALDTSEAAKVDGGLSCMTLRFSLA